MAIHAGSAKSQIRRFVLILGLPIAVSAPLAQVPSETAAALPVDFGREVRFFGGEPGGFAVPDYHLLQDPTNNRILNAALRGVTQAELEEAGIADAAARLTALVKGSCLKLDGVAYHLPFPVISGARREAIRVLVDRAVQPVVPRVTGMLDRLARATRDRRDALFHLLWSRTMDKIWWPAWQAVYPKPRGAPTVAWVIRPDHPYQVGTNYHNLPGNGEIAVTWSNRSSGHIPGIMDRRADLARIAWDLPLALGSSVETLRSTGCLDAKDQVRPFVFRAGDSVDKLTGRIAKEYAGAVAKLYDYDALAPRYQLAPGQLFVVLQHETAYAIYDRLIMEGKLTFPPALQREADPGACAQLVSLRLKKKPTS